MADISHENNGAQGSRGIASERIRAGLRALASRGAQQLGFFRLTKMAADGKKPEVLVGYLFEGLTSSERRAVAVNEIGRRGIGRYAH